MRVPFLEWFRDENGWTMPEGRRGELVGIALWLPVFAFFATRETGVPSLADHPPAVLLGVVCGFGYAVYWRDRFRSRVPEGARSFANILLGGGAGLSALEIVHLAAPTVLFVVAAGATVAGIYVAWLCWPLEDGLRPPRRGAEPPSALESSALSTADD